MKSRFIHPLFPGGLNKAFTLSYDDGVTQDERLIALFDRFGVKGTFNINSGLYGVGGPASNGRYPYTHLRFTEDKIVDMYRNHEVAVHGAEHLDPVAYPLPVIAQDVMRDRYQLERLLQHPVTGMAYPFGTFNDDVVALLKTLGIDYARTVVSTHSFDLPEDWLLLHPTCHHNDPQLMELLERFAFDTGHQLKMFYLWGHAYEFDANNNWEVMEDALQFISGRDDVWYATNGEIYRYIKAFDQLIFSADGHLVENPTATDLWLWVSKEAVCLPAGSITRIGR